VEDRELVGLLYRADWTGLTLSGTVRGPEPVIDTTIIVTEPWSPPGPWWPGRPRRPGGSPPGPPTPPDWSFAPPEHEGARTLVLVPGRRFRVESADGSWVLGSDGERVWQWRRDRPPDTDVHFDAKPRAPFRTLLVPSWLLSGYSLAQSGPETVCGRAGLRVLATPRTVIGRDSRRWRHELGGSIGLMPGPGPRWLRSEYWDEVDAIIDAELGILLRCARRLGDHEPSVTEFESLEVGGPAEAALFSAPTGSVFGRSRRPRGGPFGDAADSALSGVVREAAKTVAGLAAGGLGAAIKFGPSRNLDPFAQATAEEADPEGAMPTDEPDPDGTDAAAGASAGAVSDEVLHLLYRGGLPVPQFTATLHQWFAVDALLDAVPPGARGAGFGGVGFLIDAVRESAEDSGLGDLHSASTVRMDGWTRYRIDVTRTVQVPPEPARRRLGKHAGPPVTIASDGVHRWSVYADRAVRAPAGGVPDAQLADLLDASWLLEFRLSGGEEVEVDGRRGYRVVARSGEPRQAVFDLWERIFFPAVAVVDAETGRLLRVTKFKGGRPVLRQELRDVGPLPVDADFAFTPPPGVPVDDADADAASDEADSDSSADEWSWSAAAAEAEEEPASQEAVRDPAREAADAIRKQVDETVAAARGFLESFFGGGRGSD
jgi:hypothetical protein